MSNFVLKCKDLMKSPRDMQSVPEQNLQIQGVFFWESSETVELVEDKIPFF